MHPLLLRILPPPLVTGLQAVNATRRSARYYIGDWRRFRRHYRIRRDAVDQRGLHARLTYYTHAIEKGLSHSDLRLGFGVAALTGLVEAAEDYSHKGYPKDELPYRAALSALAEYIRIHAAMNCSPAALQSIPHWLIDEIKAQHSTLGGITHLENRGSPSNPSTQSFVELLNGRHSIREFGSAPVDLELVKDAIRIATRSPSACNRQTARVRMFVHPPLISEVKALQGGLGGYADPEIMLLVTADLRDFLDPAERNQPFVDGGIFGMTLLLALEAVGLAACPLHAMFPSAIEQAMRSLVAVEDSEVFIFFIAIGSMPDSVTVPTSFRYPVERVLITTP